MIGKIFSLFRQTSGWFWTIFEPLSSFVVALWACGQRACVVHHVHSDKVCFSRVFVMDLGRPMRVDREHHQRWIRFSAAATELATCR
jgi:hypothetical protein